MGLEERSSRFLWGRGVIFSVLIGRSWGWEGVIPIS